MTREKFKTSLKKKCAAMCIKAKNCDDCPFAESACGGVLLEVLLDALIESADPELLKRLL